ncbi:MAG: hypothetical protein H6R18_3096, partial [Proteobacteria bacterium]|nr:hypothetical protein [Pseudomonadota bacterium]
SISVGNVVTTVSHPFRNTEFGHFHTGQRQIDQFNPPAQGKQTTKRFQVTATGRGGFKCEVFALGNGRVNLISFSSAALCALCASALKGFCSWRYFERFSFPSTRISQRWQSKRRVS